MLSVFVFGLFLFYTCANASAAVVAYYPFNGNAIDESGNGNDGTVFNATLTTDRFGNADSAYSFNGIDASILVPDSPSLNFATNSFEVNFFTSPVDLRDFHRFVGKYTDSSGGWIIYGRSDGGVYANVIGSSGAALNVYMGDYELNAWHEFTLSKSADRIQTYRDGVLITTVNQTLGNTDTISNLQIGTCGLNCVASNTYANGIIDDITISAVPIPTAAWLFCSGLLGLIGIARRKVNA